MDFHAFVDQELARYGFSIKRISEEYMQRRLHDIMRFVNSVRVEYSDVYGWNPESESYFLNGLDRKWDFSYSIEKNGDQEICFVNFASVYGDIIHNHCTYAKQKYRKMNFAKLHMLKLCQSGIDDGFSYQEGYWPKHNNGSLVLFLKMGWKIEEIRKQGSQVFMLANLIEVRDRTYQLLLKEAGNG